MSNIADYPGCLYLRDLDDGRTIFVYRMLYTARVSIGPTGGGWLVDGWCYKDVVQAVHAADKWDGNGDPPDGWHRHLGSGRRREDGDPAREYVNP